MASLTTALTWVSRGRAAAHPSKYVLDQGELDRVSKLARIKVDDARLKLEAAKAEAEHAASPDEDGWEDESDSDAYSSRDVKMDADDAKPTDPNDLSAYELEGYDEEQNTSSAMGAFANIRGLQFYRDVADDPYISMKDSAEDEEEEREELEIYPTDNLLVAARTQDDVSQIDVYVYDDSKENLYVHHDFLLPAMPLCLEWLDFVPSPGEHMSDDKPGNFVAVGTLDPEIEIWSLDVIDGLYPNAILGPAAGAEPTTEDSMAPPASAKPGGKKKKPKKPKPKPSANFHIDSVLALSWNRSHRSLLASASADKTIKLWDLSRPCSCPALRSFDVHSDKVQALQWNAAEPTILLSGSWDKTVRVFDSRSPNSGVGARIGSDVECAKWNPWISHEFLISLDSGLVQSFDSRVLTTDPSTSKPLWTLNAHDTAVSALDYSSLIPDLLITGGVDHIVKVWHTKSPKASQGGPMNISLVTSRDLGVGKVFSASLSPDDPTTLAVAGSSGSLQIWDMAGNAGVRKAFGESLRSFGKDSDECKEAVVGVVDDKSDEEDEGD